MNAAHLAMNWAAAVFLVLIGSRVGAEDRLSFNQDIRPILSDKCFFCHGPDAGNRQADLRLDREDAAKEYVIVPNASEESELISRITAEDPEERMPPSSSKLSLSPTEIEMLRRWIDQGAEWDRHWAFVAPTKVSLPPISKSDWVVNEIDQFVLAKLQQKSLEPSPPASRERLLRRVTFDLTGLPPTVNDIDRYLADDSELAYESLVDGLLDSPRFGERMAAEWLDVARYSDSYGYQVDRDRFVWPWRDWVVRAFNDNMPYDRFITEQLAGDLLPNATSDQILATTFNRLHPQKVEGGSTPEEFRIEYVADRTQTFATAFLGLTMECARCHDHKFDPIAQKEYYQLSAFFNNIDEAGLYSYFTDSVPTPTLLLTEEATASKIEELDKQIAAVIEEMQTLAEEPPSSDNLNFQKIVGSVAHLDFEDIAGGPNESVPGRVGKAIRLTGDDGVDTKVGNFHRYQPFSVALWMNTPDVKERAVVFHRSRAWTDAGSRGYQLLIEDGCLSASLIHFWPGNAIRVRTQERIPVDTWLHVVMTYDGSSQANGLRLFVNGREAECDVVRDNLFKNVTGGGGDTITIGERFRDRGFSGGLVDEFRVFDRALTALEAAQLHDGKSLTRLISIVDSDLTPSERRELRAYELATAVPEYQAHQAQLQDLRQQRCELADKIPEIMVMREMPVPRVAHVLVRGAYDMQGEPVARRIPDCLPPFPDNQPRNRLGLARWLTMPNHPLTARVAVNRYWQAIFGKGLVRTPEDFGSQGDPPTHPELLDWLARDFQEHGWNVKRLIKQMVMSATYRQSSNGTPSVRESDPQNLWLARSPSYRLSAEMLRDNALAVSGLLVTNIGGPPARPYEVEASFKPVERHKGDGLYRRSLYTYWKRTAPAPAMMTLDAAKRDVCRMRRERTSSPLQAFVLMNGPQFVEAARQFAQKLVQRHVTATDDLFARMFREVCGRRPTAAELAVLHRLYSGQLAYFQADTVRADRYLAVGDSPRDMTLDASHLAAVAAVANTLMNLDESVMKR
jgi:hypothetical protein